MIGSCDHEIPEAPAVQAREEGLSGAKLAGVRAWAAGSRRSDAVVLGGRDPGLASETVDIRSLTLKVELNESLRQLVKPGDSVFVYAKAASGPPMPLAVKRLAVSDLPAEVTLSDADAMMPQMKLSAFDLVVVGARVSKTGNPVAQPGDLFVEVTGIDSSNPPQDLLLSINQVK